MFKFIQVVFSNFSAMEFPFFLIRTCPNSNYHLRNLFASIDCSLPSSSYPIWPNQFYLQIASRSSVQSNDKDQWDRARIPAISRHLQPQLHQCDYLVCQDVLTAKTIFLGSSSLQMFRDGRLSNWLVQTECLFLLFIHKSPYSSKQLICSDNWRGFSKTFKQILD